MALARICKGKISPVTTHAMGPQVAAKKAISVETWNGRQERKLGAGSRDVKRGDNDDRGSRNGGGGTERNSNNVRTARSEFQ